MKTIMLLLLLVVVMVGACNPADDGARQTIDNVQISLVVEPDPAAVGETTLVITLTDVDGRPIDGATVRVHGNMDHEGMIPVEGESADSEAGVYRVPFAWTMGGGWILDVTATLPDDGGIVVERFDLNVSAISQESVITQHDGNATQRDQEAMAADDIVIGYIGLGDAVMPGDATVRVTITDGNGNPIDDAQVTLTGTMNHAGMMPISGEADSSEDGYYRIPVQWTMVGDWHVEIQVTLADGRQTSATFDQHVMDTTETSTSHDD